MKIVVGMSGGVDSSVAALTLKEQGHQVIGVFMKNWDDSDDEFCSAATDSEDARIVAEQLGIPFYTFNFEKEYLDNVFQDFLEAFQKGYTPNPDILCNREIKFKPFLEKALKLKADKIATGHYAQIKEDNGEYKLMKAADENKDQSYFLCALGQKELSKSLFPIGGMQKKDLRQIAKKHKLHVHDKKDSTGICFIGERKFKDFLSKFLPAKAGDICDLEGKVIGRHEGSMYFTIGQREGLGIGGPGGPWYVIDKDVKKNIVYATQGADHPKLFSKTLVASDMNWISGREPKSAFKGRAKVRYRQSDQAVTLKRKEAEKYFFEFDKPQRAVTLGQYIVIYDNDECLGGGVIIARD